MANLRGAMVAAAVANVVVLCALLWLAFLPGCHTSNVKASLRTEMLGPQQHGCRKSGVQQHHTGMQERHTAQFPGLPCACEGCLVGMHAFSIAVDGASALYDAPTDAGGNTDPTLFDFKCLDWHTGQWFHRLLDCMVPVCSLLHPLIAGGGAHAVRISPQIALFWPWFDGVLRATNTSYHVAGEHEAFRRTVSVGGMELTSNATAMRSSPRACKQCAREVGLRAAGVAPGGSCDSILLISRQGRRGTRRILDDDALYQRLQEVVASRRYAATQVIKFTDASLDDTVRQFGRACAVVAYHGAGLANTMFSPLGSLVLEITTYGHTDFARLHVRPDAPWMAQASGMGVWRTNIVAAQNLAPAGTGSVQWALYVVDFDHLLPAPERPQPPANSSSRTGSQWREYLTRSNVRLGRAHIDNIALRVEAFLEAHKLVPTHASAVRPCA